MEDDEAALIFEAARDIIEKWGGDALDYVTEQEEIARAQGHIADADAWLDIAGAVADLLRES